MLAGKLIGVGAVGLTQVGIWLVAGAILLGTPIAATVLSGEYAVHVSATEAILFPVYFLLGYLLYSSLFAGLAASCETEQELQMYMPLAAAPTWLSFSLIVVVMNDSNSHLGDCRFPIPTHCADHHVPAHGFAGSARCGNSPSPSGFWLSASSSFCGYRPSSTESAF